ncbi:RluA family pseudouridine synthase [Caproiciproducens faecalis]|uniref:Pseudouridine synthase n=1 Tax=Caproiciproducens faecalis TaxID=2820301 RepID=A0ABS7DQE6_9FIRM|nr:RluA family pseudouridine synthase [Caproiciproducens faecalis]MBW7573483.1 RluA family pseudouridine synthase [Caproiciproducens faecalis]
MRELSFLVPKEYDGIRLKSFLRSYCGISARLMIRLKREPAGITRNGQHAIVTEILKAEDEVRIRMPDDTKLQEPLSVPLAVVYEDSDLLVLNKPAAMPMYPTPGHDCDSLANAAAAYFLSHGERLSFRPVYRLDKDTTGLVVLAKNSFCAAQLAGRIEKEYVAVCEGILTGEGTVDEPIGLKEGHRIQREVTDRGERAITHWRTLQNGNGYSLVSFQLKTGRTHQIRVHMAHIGHPLAGDDLYGGNLRLISRQALHCMNIHFIHPITRKRTDLSSTLPEDMRSLLGTCGME